MRFRKATRSLVLAASCLLVTLTVLFSASGAYAANCGKVSGNKIVTHGGLSCKTARHIYKLFKSGKKVPSGWVCGLSAGGCSKGSKSFTFRFN